MGAKKAALKAPKEPKAPKAAPKKLSQTNGKPKPAPKKRSKPDSDDEDDISVDDNVSLHDNSLLSNTPPSAKKQKKVPAPKKATKPLATVENEAMGLLDGVGEAKPKKTESSDRYQKVTKSDHCILSTQLTSFSLPNWSTSSSAQTPISVQSSA